MPLLTGICIAFLVLTPVLKLLFDVYPTYTSAFFFGLIISSAGVMFVKIRFEITWKSSAFILIGLIAGLLIVGIQGVQTEHSHIMIFLSGIISFCAMILPGISGAFILYLFGQYEFMLGVLHQIEQMDFSKLSFAFVYVVGGIIGLLVFSRLLSYLFRKYKGQTISFVIGLMLGALRIPAEKIILNMENLIFTILVGVLGASIVFLVSYYGNWTTSTTK
jgi:putative membrane protein